MRPRPLSPRAASSRLPHPGAEDGLTLIELVVAMAIGLILMAVVVALFTVVLHQQSRLSDSTQADRGGRIALTKIVEELHSSCTGTTPEGIQTPAVTPTSPLKATGPESLWFVTTYGTSSAGAPTPSVEEHDILWTAEKPASTMGELTDYSFTSTGASLTPKASSAAHTVVLAEHVIEPAEGIFHYYAYGTGGELSTKAMTAPLSAATAQEAAEVTISFAQAPEDGDTNLDRAANFSDSVVLGMGPLESTDTKVAPCE